MSISAIILRHRPDMLYVWSGPAPYVDLSRRRLASVTPTATRWPVSPARGIRETNIFTGAATLNQHKAPSSDFTVMSLSKPLSSTATNLLGFTGNETDGIWQTGNTVFFAVKHADAGVTSVSVDVDGSKIHLLTGVATSEKLTLYVDGDTAVTKEVTNSTVMTMPSTLYVGSNARSVHGLSAFWNKALGGAAVYDIWSAALPVPLRSGVLGALNIGDLRLTANSADLEEFTFSDIYPYLPSNATVSGSRILASYDSSLTSTSGSIRFPIPFVSTTTGIRVSWNSSNGAVVSYSTDGIAFNAITNGTTFGSGATITDQPIIEVSFPGGATNEMFLDSFKAERQVGPGLVPTISNGREVSFSGSVSLGDVGEFRRYPSLPSTFGSNGKVIIDPETEDVSLLTSGVEFWFTPAETDVSGTKYIMDSNPDKATTISIVSGLLNWTGFGSVYINGSLTTTNTFTVQPGAPLHFIGLFSTPDNAKLTFGRATLVAQGNLSALGIIRTGLTAGEAQSVFDNQQDVLLTRIAGIESTSVSDTSVSNWNLVWTTGSQ